MVKILEAGERRTIGQQQTRPLLDALHEWMTLQCQKARTTASTVGPR